MNNLAIVSEPNRALAQEARRLLRAGREAEALTLCDVLLASSPRVG
jgi:hypothetical protein